MNYTLSMGKSSGNRVEIIGIQRQTIQIDFYFEEIANLLIRNFLSTLFRTVNSTSAVIGSQYWCLYNLSITDSDCIPPTFSEINKKYEKTCVDVLVVVFFLLACLVWGEARSRPADKFDQFPRNSITR